MEDIYIYIYIFFFFFFIGSNNYNHYNITTCNKTYSMLLTKRERLTNIRFN